MIEHNLISIITPVYNGEKFIEACLKNVIAQDSPFVEHVIIDGASSDRTIDIVKAYQQRYAHISWISEKDKGQPDAMNKGIQRAKGEIIGVLNVDDYYEEGVLTKILQIFKTLPVPSFICGNCNCWDDKGILSYVNMPKNLGFKELLLGEHTHPFPVNPSAYFYHKAIHQMIGMYDLKEDNALDLDFVFRAVRKAHVYYFDELWGNYRLLKGTKTVRLMESGGLDFVQERIFQHYRNQLSWPDRFFVFIYGKATKFLFKGLNDLKHLIKAMCRKTSHNGK
ncbi:MAG: glycosyltransferase [Candidatus Omnitrophica bacterium]|nr:glycosyltransferase [Candidatus Omnitrophota bacterium]